MHPSSIGSLSARGLEVSLAALQRLDPCVRTIVDVASQVALYTFSSRSGQWEKTQVEGTLFIYSRLTSPRHGFTIMNRLDMQNLTEAISQDLDLQLQEPFLLYRNARLVLHGIWFYDQQDCRRVADMMKLLTQQEQVLARSQTEDCIPADGAAVDIVQMLTRAHSQYEKEKASSEPKEIWVSGDLHRNLIKPIPVKPSTQDAKPSGSTSISLETLFSSCAPQSAARGCRPPVASILTNNSLSIGRPELLSGPQNKQLNCPALQKVFQDQRGTLGLPTESPRRHRLRPPHQSEQLVSASSSSSHRDGLQHGLSPSRPLVLYGSYSQGSGSVSPYDLLQRLELVQQQQTKVCLGLALSQNQERVYSGLQAQAQLEVVSPQSITATASPPTLLLSPSVFTQIQSRDRARVLSRSQLQAALLHLIQSDSSFLDNIYHTYISRSSNICSSK